MNELPRSRRLHRPLPGAVARASARRGQAMVETALILPIILLVFAGTLDLGRVFFAQIQVATGAREGAIYGRLAPTDSTGIVASVKDSFQGGLVGGATDESASPVLNGVCATPSPERLCVAILCFQSMTSNVQVAGGCANATTTSAATAPPAIEVQVAYTFKPLLTSITGVPLTIPLRTSARQAINPAP